MPKSGAPTKEKILDTAQNLVLDYGFAGTSVDMVIEKAGITKGTFFYHFKTKNHLAKELIHRFHANDLVMFNKYLERAERMSSDPVQQLLIFVGSFEEMLDQLTEPYPGCLFAAYVYQSQQFDEEIMCYCSTAMTEWREMCGNIIRRILEKYEPKKPIDVNELADFFIVILEGALLISKTMNDAKLAAPHLEHYRKYVELLFLDS